MPTPNEKLIDASKTNSFEQMIEAIKEGANPNLVCDDQGNTPAHIFASRDKVEQRSEKIEFLKTKNADFSIKNAQGDLPIHSAISAKKSASVVMKLMDVMLSELLHVKNAKGNTLPELLAEQELVIEFLHLVSKPDFDINLKGATDQSPLVLAIKIKARLVVQKLVERNAIIYTSTLKQWTTPLHLTVQQKDMETLSAVLAHKDIKTIINVVDKEKHSALYEAANGLMLDTVNALLELGAVVGFKTTPMLDAVKNKTTTDPLPADKVKAAKKISKILEGKWNDNFADAKNRMRSASHSNAKGTGFDETKASFNLSLPRERPPERTVIPAKSAGAASTTLLLSPRSAELDEQITTTANTANKPEPIEAQSITPNGKRVGMQLSQSKGEDLHKAIAEEDARIKAEKETEKKAKMEAEEDAKRQAEAETTKAEEAKVAPTPVSSSTSLKNPGFVGGTRTYGSPISQPAPKAPAGPAPAGSVKKYPTVTPSLTYGY